MTTVAANLLADLTRDQRQLLSSRAQALQMLPAIAVKALEVTRDPNCSILDFVSIVERDAKLATDILRMSNSTMFCTSNAVVRNLRHAVVRLGFRQCRNLILSTSISTMLRSMPLEEEWIRDLLTRHALLTGIVAVHLNTVADAGFQGEEFAAGLVHDFGRSLLAVCMPSEYPSADPLDFDESVATLERESWLLGFNHSQAGAWFATRGGLPSEFVDVILYHHAPEESIRNRRLVALIAVSDHIANHIQRCGTDPGYDLNRNPAVPLLEEGGITNALLRLQDVMPEIMESSQREAEEMCRY